MPAPFRTLGGSLLLAAATAFAQTPQPAATTPGSAFQPTRPAATTPGSAVLPSNPAATAPGVGAAPAASAPGTRPPPRRQSPTEARDNATMPGDMRPENRVEPLITLPLGRKAGDPGTVGPATGTVDDTMARCKAMPPGPARTDCLRQARITAPQR